MMTSNRSRNILQSEQKSALAKMVARNLLFIDFSAEMPLRKRSLALAKENFYCLSWLASRCLFLGSSRMNLKALRMQYFTSYSRVFLREVKRASRVCTIWLLRHFGKRRASSSGSDGPRWEFSTRKAMMSLLKTSHTRAHPKVVATDCHLLRHYCCLTMHAEGCFGGG